MPLLPTLSPNSPTREAFERMGEPAPGLPSLDGLDCLAAVGFLETKHPRQLLRLIAGWLSTRETIWWGALCITQDPSHRSGPFPKGALKAIADWVLDPTENNTALAGKASSLGGEGPANLLCQAITLTNHNLSPMAKESVTCPPGLSHKLVAHAILSTLDSWPGSNKNACYSVFVELGLDITEGKSFWEKRPEGTRPGLRPLETETPRKTGGKIWENW